MPLARMMLSSSQRCSSKRRTCGSPRLSRIGCGGWITFMTFPLMRRQISFRSRAGRLEDRRPAHEFVLEHARRLVRTDVEHRLEAEPEQLLLEHGVRNRL